MKILHLLVAACISLAPTEAAGDVDWAEYRLTDVINGWYFIEGSPKHESCSHENLPQERSCTPEKLQEVYREAFPGSIAADYLTKTHAERDLVVLKEVVEEHRIRNNVDAQGAHMLVVHVRLGDTVSNADQQWDGIQPEGESGNRWTYAKPKAYYEGTIDYEGLHMRGVSDVVVVGSIIHCGSELLDCEEREAQSIKYKGHVSEFFRSRGFKVTERFNGGTPDEDFAFCATASTFVQGGGGFSKLMGDVIKLNGGTVLGGEGSAGWMYQKEEKTHLTKALIP